MKQENFVIVCRQLIEKPEATQRELAVGGGLSLGLVNATIKECLAEGYLLKKDRQELVLTEKGQAYLELFRVKNAVILTAGFGIRCVPLTYETPKGLLEVYGKPMIERQIEQLLEKGINDIVLVVGYKKEMFDYLIDKFGVKLVYNREYGVKNTLTSLYYVAEYLDSTYLLEADNWIENNVFHLYEAYNWHTVVYMQGPTHELCAMASATDKIESMFFSGEDDWAIIGPAYFSPAFSKKLKVFLIDYYNRPGTENFYWEQIMVDHIDELPMYLNRQTGNVHEFENLEELRMFDPTYINASNNQVMEAIAEACCVPEEEISDIFPIKAGVINNSFRFSIKQDSYVCRIPRNKADKMLEPQKEKAIYKAIQHLGISDEIVSLDTGSGVKITRYFGNARITDPFDDRELELCMKQIRIAHESGVTIPDTHDIDEIIEYYIESADTLNAIRFSDIRETREKYQQLLDIRRKLGVPHILYHGDYNHSNVMITQDGEVKILDWEYGGMGDPLIDVAMYAIFAGFNRERVDYSLRLYLKKEPLIQERIRLYLNIALSGLLWAMWSQYNQAIDQEFGDYPLRMYRYMKDYYLLTIENYQKLIEMEVSQ